MKILFENFSFLLALAAVLCAITVEFNMRRAKLRRRIVRLQTADDLLKKHLVAMQAFVEDDNAPAKMKERLLIFSEFISDQEEFVDITREICDAMSSGRPPEVRNTQKEFDALRSRHPALATTFEKAITSGVGSAFLRFPAAGEIMEATMARVYAEPRTEIEYVAEATQKRKTELKKVGALAVVPA